MELYVARQPIFDPHMATVGYELLHRESEKWNECTETDGGYASSRVITGAFLSSSMESLTSGKLAFINFTGELLTSGVAMLLPREQLVVEVLESVPPTREVLRACTELKARGYTIALDDYVMNPVFEPLANLADIIKVDIRQNSDANLQNAITAHKGRGVRFLAEKMETEEEFQLAVTLGYDMFQGYFFSKPVILSANTIPTSKIGYLRLVQAVNDENPDFGMIAAAIENDVELSLETIRLSNSAFYGRRKKISSIRQAVVALGLDGVRKWIYLSALRRLGLGKPDALVSTSIVRSKFMEQIAYAAGQYHKNSEYAMIGLFSLLDALTGCTFETLLAGLNITGGIKDVLLGGGDDTMPGAAYKTMLAYERGEWDNTAERAGKLGLTLDEVAEAYLASLRWYHEFMKAAA